MRYYITDPAKGTFAGYTNPDRQPTWITTLEDMNIKDVCYYGTEAEARIAARILLMGDPSLRGIKVEKARG